MTLSRAPEVVAADEAAAGRRARPERPVVFVSAVTGHGGPNASLRLVVPRLRGFQAVLVGPYTADEARASRAAGVPVEAIPRPRGARGLLAAMGRIARILLRYRKHRPIVFANGLTEAAIVAPGVLALRLRGLVWIHNYAPPRVARVLSPLLRHLARRRLHLAAVSNVAAGVGRSVFGPEPTIRLVPNPIDPRLPPPEVPAAAAPRRRLRVAYLAGTDRWYKGFDLLPEILEASDGCAIDWLIVAVEATQPKAWRRLRAVMERLETATVTLRGRTDRVQDLYAWTDVVLIPSRQESFCRVAAEALAAGVGVVAARLPAIEEVCGEVALFFTPEDCRGAAEVLRELALSPATIERSRELGRRRAERFATGAVVAELEAALAEVADEGAPRRGLERVTGL